MIIENYAETVEILPDALTLICLAIGLAKTRPPAFDKIEKTHNLENN